MMSQRPHAAVVGFELFFLQQGEPDQGGYWRMILGEGCKMYQVPPICLSCMFPLVTFQMFSYFFPILNPPVPLDCSRIEKQVVLDFLPWTQVLQLLQGSPWEKYTSDISIFELLCCGSSFNQSSQPDQNPSGDDQKENQLLNWNFRTILNKSQIPFYSFPVTISL